MIQEITATQTYPLRHQVLWPDKPVEFVKVPDDEQGIHLGYFLDEKLVSVISLFIDEHKIARFRKFATHPDIQRKGIGSQLLKATFERAQSAGASILWCDARLDTQPFYERFDMKSEGEVFYKGEIPYVKMAISF
ncbi:GNAT family N-acetyltransferase [Runella sp. SP2]|uniref:GNAT family N-acetyltransferase n=1 Tax=Runella sp. SP2 TaxID=2268026 RepID=UPI000F073CC8|nr:GNAT family N-acetyltransferase [Runella sp. SP2]AYQ35487.1 GNAT family N-acetyltransferase [Runella sp. SP2]